jgi:hypothetical protein
LPGQIRLGSVYRDCANHNAVDKCSNLVGADMPLAFVCAIVLVTLSSRYSPGTTRVSGAILRFTFAGIVATLGVCSGVHAQDAPSLTDTLSWIESTYNDHFEQGGGFGYGVWRMESDGKLAKKQDQSVKSSGCQFQTDIRDDPDATLAKILYTPLQRTKFNLKDIDPDSLIITKWSSLGGLSCNLEIPNLPCNQARLEVQTKNKLPLMDVYFDTIYPKLTGANHETKTQAKSFITDFVFDNVEYAYRFMHAFKHAVSLCGGKPSPF